MISMFVYKVFASAAFALVTDQNMRTNVHKQIFGVAILERNQDTIRPDFDLP